MNVTCLLRYHDFSWRDIMYSCFCFMARIYNNFLVLMLDHSLLGMMNQNVVRQPCQQWVTWIDSGPHIMMNTGTDARSKSIGHIWYVCQRLTFFVGVMVPEVTSIMVIEFTVLRYPGYLLSNRWLQAWTGQGERCASLTCGVQGALSNDRAGPSLPPDPGNLALITNRIVD